MDVIFEPQRGRPFSIEVGFFDTILEIKEKVQKYQGIPISEQTLIFNGQPLRDDADIDKCQILHNSRIHLQIASAKPPPPPSSKAEELSPAQSPPLKKKPLRLNVKSPSSKAPSPLEMDPNDTVSKLKERIQKMEAVPNNSKLVLHLGGAELNDNQVLRDCKVSESNCEIDVSFRLLPGAAASGGGGGGGGGAKKLKVMVLAKCGTRKIAVEVNANDNVGELRKELQKLNQRVQFHLPAEGYFFIYKQNVMDDDMSFRWHQVREGDTIEIFNGSVTGGGS